MQHHNRHLFNHRARRHTRRQPIDVQSDQSAFRVVCHLSIISGLIGHSGSVISQIRRETGCVIHCEELVQGSDHRVVVVVGSRSPDRTIWLKSDKDEEEWEEVVSAPQEAVLRVLERIWEVDADIGGIDEDENGARDGYCGLLVDTRQIGAVVGRGGKNIRRMRRKTGAHILILPAPRCAAMDDELIQITGGILAVKEAVCLVTGVLQDCPPYEQEPTPLTRASNGPTCSSDLHAEFFPHLYSLLPTLTESYRNCCSWSTDAGKDVSPATEANEQEVSFRLLCPKDAAGLIIGKKGTIVRALQNETGASIMFASPLTKSDESVVTISAYESLESSFSPAQNAVVLVFARSLEYVMEKGRLSGLIQGTDVTARLLVASHVVWCLRGSGEGVDLEMKETTGADVQILERDQALDCVSGDDVVVQITGVYTNVQNALFQVTGKLRNNLLPSEVVNEVRARSPNGRLREITSSILHQPAGLSLDSNPETSLTLGMNQLGLSESTGDPPAPGPQLRQNLARECTTSIIDNESTSTTFVRGSELERSLHFLLPRMVHNEVGARSPDRGMRGTTCPGLLSLKTTCPGLHSSLNPSPDSVPETNLSQGNDKLELANSIGGTLSRLQLRQSVGGGHTIAVAGSETGQPTFGRSLELESKKNSAIMANSTVKLLVSKDFLGSVCGEDGSNLAHLRQVEVCDPSPGKSERVVVVSGTTDQTVAAKSLLQAFILAGQ